MGTVPDPHQSPMAPRDRDWDWSGTQKLDALLDHGDWDAAMTAHAWFDPEEDPEHDPPQEKGANKLPHHELIEGVSGSCGEASWLP